MKSLCLWVIFAVVLDAIQLGESSFHGWRRCGQNERYVDCVKRCNTCASRGHCYWDSISCEPGCDCLEGYFRNRQGRCVPADLCDEPSQPPCRFDEEFKKCGCVKSCCNHRNSQVCSKQCLTGCFCREGLVRDQFGNCIRVENCPRKPAENCRNDEQYYTNKPDCKNTCENYDNPAILCLIGQPGCFCKEGLVKRKDGKCVPPEECSGGNCRIDEQYYTNKPDCKNTCENYNNPGVRCRAGEPGCFCKEGLVKRKDGKCVRPEDCSGGCGYNEEIVECAKPKWCNTCEIKGNCKLSTCTRGCDCKKGYLRNQGGTCINAQRCPGQPGKACGMPESCADGCYIDYESRPCPFCRCPTPPEGQCLRRNEVFKKCSSPCEMTCFNYLHHFRIGIVCPHKCKPGCFCKDGFIRNSNRDCVEPSQCEIRQCGENAEYKICGPACPATCTERSPICIQSCTPGCFCKPGFIKENEGGRCVPENQCPTGQCLRKGEVYKKCGSPCEGTCFNYIHHFRIGILCQQKCKPGCFCKNGLLRDGNRNCVKPSECKNEICPLVNCKRGCYLDRNAKPCPKCVCERNPKEVCGENEEYQPCGTACPPTCANQNRICIQVCRPGCFCKRGFIRLGDRGRCIPKNLCPPVQCSTPVCAEGCRIDYSSEPCPSCKCDSNPNEVCGENEEYQPCGTACPPTCVNQDRICIQVCRPGCFCKRGFIRGSDRGGCIPKELCPPVQCAIPVCAEGCRVDYSSDPCPSCKCDSNPKDRCPPGEEYLVCGSSCPRTCDNYGEPLICPKICVPGCHCKKGLVRAKDGRCIIPERCRKDKCNKDEEFQSCGTACPDTCDNYGTHRICSRQCVAGCFCKSGLVRGSDCRCIPPTECSGGIQCSTPVCAEGCRIDYDSKPCPSCKCDTGPGGGQCSPPLCREPCRIDYNSKPCPTCKCDVGPGGQCRANEEYLECGPSCPSTCDNYGESRICPAVCVPGCFCKKGLVRTKDGRCVMPERCPRDKCNDDEEFRSCGSACPDTCENYGKTRVCTMQCVAGCFCKSGLVRGDNFRCIPPEQCPQGIQCAMPKCAKGCRIDYDSKPCPSCICDTGPGGQCQRRGEVYKECGSLCEGNCFNYLHGIRIGIVCPHKCKPGCFCKDGLIRDSNRDCVEPNQCNNTSIQCSPPRCAEGCKIDYSTKPCPSCNCNGGPPGIQCTPPRCAEGCKIDYNTKPCPSCNCNGGPPGQCLRRGEVFRECGYLCEGNCFNYLHGIRIGIVCPYTCKPGCYCKEGLLRDSNRDCVEPDQCNSTSIQCSPPHCAEGCKIDYNTKPCPSCNCNGSPPGIQCSPPRCAEGCKIDYNTKPCPSCNCNGRTPDQCRADEKYSECGTCEDTCDDYGKPRVCIAACIPGCFCQSGMVRTNDGRCVIPELCGKVPDQCNDDEDFRTCGSSCPGTCDNRGKPRACSFICIRGCFCKSGLIRSSDFKCIPPEECPRDRSCPAIDCIEGCYLDSNTKPCPTCVCPRKPTEPPCPTPMCMEGCEIDYSGRCPTCKCDTLPEGPQCDMPKCDDGCRIDYSTKPCPSCNCDSFPGGPQCDMPKCDEGCRIDYSTKPCPSCKCGSSPGGPKCGIPRCKEGCKIDYSTKPCPSCKCGAGGNDNPPSDYYDEEEDYEYESEDDYESEDEYEYESEENTDTGGDTGPACSIPACKEGCKIVKVPNEPCPKCVCPKGPICLLPFCREGCKIVKVPNGPCPKCVCPKGPICHLPLCREGCKIVKLPNQPCPKCVCPNEPPGEQCGQDEEHVECVPCGNTCETYEQRLYCKPACRPGCTCRDGLVKRKDGKCVTPSECNSTTGEPVCRQNEEYYECMPTCKGKCETYDKPILCNQLCVAGCFCKKGFVKRKDGECVKPENCLNEPDDCGENEEYRSCGTACPPTCVNRKPTCVKKCVKGCFCKKGFVKDADGKCIPLNQCPKETCGKHEVYNSCGTACQPTCQIPDPPCTKQCAQGCFCREGYIRETKDGECIPRRFCDDNKECGLNEEYSDCAIPCNDCETKGKCNFLVCNRGCDCIKGYFRDSQGKCIPENQCPNSSQCGLNEEYSDCANPCNDCEIKGKCNFLVCNKGCDCIKGYFRDSKGKCIPENQCPNSSQCGPEEQYYKCKPDCRNTCESYGKNDTICTEECSEGCFCKEGLVKRKDGKCVKPEQCSEELCGPEEEYYRCKPFCANRCQPQKICPRICLPGCFCRQGLVLGKDDKCVPKDQCGQTEPVCKEDEQFYQCIPECRNNCKAYGRDDIVCSAICKPGCFCKEGLIKRSDGKCVTPDQCNATMPTCPKDEQYYQCKPECGNTCETCGKDIACPAICEPGCFCKEGLVRRSDGKCVEKDECDDVPDRPCPQIKCSGDCYLDENHKPCPRCVCDEEPIDGPCPQIRCRSGCSLDESHKPCPRCVCDEEPKECRKLKCSRECKVDKSAKPCPRCICPKLPRRRLCPTEQCLPGCHTEYRLNECPRCVCPKGGRNGNGRLCPTEQCLPGCHTEYRENECPRCVCPKNRRNVDESSDSENDSSENDFMKFDSSESVSRTEDERSEFEEENFSFQENTNDRRKVVTTEENDDFDRDYEGESRAYDFSSETESEEDYDYSDYEDEVSDDQTWMSEDQSSSSY